MAAEIKRGDILYASLGMEYNGSLQGGTRPVVVVSNNMANRHSTVITAVPLSTKIFKKKNLPTHVFIHADNNNGLEQDSIALCEQVTALNTMSVTGHIGRVDRETLDSIIKSVQIQIGVWGKQS